MAASDISVESVEVILVSEIGTSAAAMMKDAYLPHTGKKPDAGQAGPDARVVITKRINRTPDEVIERIRTKEPDRTPQRGNHDFYTVILTMSMQLGDPSTTRLINGMIGFACSQGEEIFAYSPQDKRNITALIENGGDAIALSHDLAFSAPATRDTKILPENRIAIPVIPGKTAGGTYSIKNGYLLDIPASSLLEYQGLLKNRHEVFFEIYPPMPPWDNEMQKGAMLAVFALIIRAPKNKPRKLRAIIECRVKGNLWGMIPLTGSVDIP